MYGSSESLKNPFCARIVSAIGIYQVYRYIKFLWCDLRIIDSHFLRGLIDHLVFGYMLPAVNPERTKSTCPVIDQNRPLIVIVQAIPPKSSTPLYLLFSNYLVPNQDPLNLAISYRKKINIFGRFGLAFRLDLI